MTIREIERRSGLERGNIRFYEREGLIEPVRQENGYRDYSEDDLALLLKIKLLRRLGFTLEAIRAMIRGETDLESALSERLGEIEAERSALHAAGQVCESMWRDGARFDTLDAQRYLDDYDRAAHTPKDLPRSIAPAVPRSDYVYPVREPWRRYFARTLDLSLAELLCVAVGAAVFRINFARFTKLESWLLGLLVWAVLLPIEAFALSRFGTTVGKRVLGLRVEHCDGRRLTYGEALWRTLAVFLYGCGCCIPIVSVWRNWKSYKAVQDEGAMWDEDVTLTFEDKGRRQIAAYCAVLAATAAFTFCLMQFPSMPVHRGELTVEEFVDNYNELARFYGDDAQLQPDGTDRNSPLVLNIETMDGIVTGVSYDRQFSSSLPGSYADLDGKEAILLSAMALAWADSSYFESHKSENKEVLERFSEFSEGSLERSLLGWHLTYTIESDPDSLAEPVYSGLTERRYTISFAMRRMDVR